MPYRTFSAADQYTDPIQISGRFNVEVFTTPTGATLQLQKSVDGGTTYYAVYDDTTICEYTTKVGKVVNNFGTAHYRLYCTVYAATSFVAGISGGNIQGT